MRYTIYIIIALALIALGYFFLAPQSASESGAGEESSNTCRINIVIYSAPYCSYCDLAKEILKSQNIPYNEIDISEDREKAIEMVEKTGQKSIPQIIVNGYHIGGYSELNNFKITGQLKEFLRTCDIAALKRGT